MRIPAETHRFHLPQSDPRCDTLEILNMAARRGEKYVDCNACVSVDDTSWNLHWPEGPRLNHYDWIWTGKRRFGREVRRPMTDRESRRNVDQWSDAQIARWRRAKRGGPRPATCGQRNRQAKRRSVYICWELKSRLHALDEVAERLVDDVSATGWPAFYMALVTLGFWGPKARAIHNAGGQFALLAHGAPKPSNFETFRPFIDAIWGEFR